MDTGNNHKCCKFILACALTWMICVFVLGLLSSWFGYGNAMVFVLSSIYIGYSPTFWGSVLGAIWAFADIIVLAVVVYLIYRLIAGKNCCNKKSNCNEPSNPNENKINLKEQAVVKNSSDIE